MSYFDEDALEGELKISVKCREDGVISGIRRARKLKKKEEENVCSHFCGLVRSNCLTYCLIFKQISFFKMFKKMEY